ncbi:hypothetical protein FOB58_005396 [Candida parapsilosis]|uniref:Uncharacterized protein n=1 Tax=Candida parapsilosis TaxID=5480 RepID=A0A8X7NJ46_CANPA|nr:hypothetical protein FOB58_005396 [Candida parapsilosis]KAF6043822.1 hypothetical protein FOB59_004778 [Candida parapsilosis]KAF6045559.1 hypothetical protein FOB60_005131 [Candida parapsilosis]KAF6060345.1 hypothetical protein FOB61_005360 [Candida parapsilosis]KAI5905453.1 hypothetical protein K4G60_g4712 [Candida parapsilosis]
MLIFHSSLAVIGIAAILDKVEASTPQNISHQSANYDVNTVICGILIFAAGAVTIALALAKDNKKAATKSSKGHPISD